MYVQVVDALPDAVLVVADQRIAWANRAAGELLGARPGSLVGAPMHELLSERDLERVGRRLARGNRSVFRLALQRWDDHRPVMVDGRVVPRAASDGQTYLFTAREVEQLDGVESVMARLGEALLASTHEVDLSTIVETLGPVFRARLWSGALWSAAAEAARLEHVIAGELLGRPTLDLARSLQGEWISYDELPVLSQVVRAARGVFVDDAEKLVADMHRRRGGTEAQAETVERSLCERRLSRAVWAPVSGPRGVEYVLTVLGTDMTEADFVAVLLVAHHVSACLALGRLSAELVSKERTAALGEMSSLVAHEMRMPVSILYNAVGELGRVEDAQRREALLCVMREESTQLMHLVDNLIHFARPLAACREPVALDQVVTRALARARNAHAETAPAARVNVDVPSPAPVVLADPVLLSHALANLLSNAFEHVVADGEIRVIVDRATHGDVRVRVFNEGPSVPLSDAERIFDPFVTRRPGGAGLGLAVVRRVVEALDGQVQMDRTPSGTSFSIWLPAAVQRARLNSATG